MEFTKEQIDSTLNDLFLNEIKEEFFIKNFIPLPIERTSDEVNRRNKASYKADVNWYKSRYDEYLIFNEYNKIQVEQIIKLKAERFLQVNKEFDKEVFYRTNCLLFTDNIKDYLDSFRRGKNLLIYIVNDYHINHFQLSYNETTGKTILVTTKNQIQLEIYFKAILNFINDAINEFEQDLSENKQNKKELIEINSSKECDSEKLKIKTTNKAKEFFDAIDKKGWNYVFKDEEDYSNYVKILVDFFNTNKKVKSNYIIKTNNRVKTKTAKCLRDIYDKFSKVEIIRNNTAFFDVVRVLKPFEGLSDDEIYNTLTK